MEQREVVTMQCSSQAATRPGVAVAPKRKTRKRRLPKPLSQFELDGEPDIIDCIRAALFGRGYGI